MMAIKKPHNSQRKEEVIVAREMVKEEERILVKEFVQGIVLGFLAGFLAAYLMLG